MNRYFKRFIYLIIIVVIVTSNYIFTFSMSQLYFRKYHDIVLYDHEYCVQNNINCYEIIYRILCGKEEYYICEMTESGYADRPNYYLLNNKYEPAFDSGFYSQFIETELNSGDQWTEVVDDIKGSFSEQNLTLYLGQNILNFENDNEIVEYDLVNKKIIDVKKKKYGKNIDLPNGTTIVDTIDAIDGRLYIVKNENGNAVLDENGKVIIDYCNSITIDNAIYMSYKWHEIKLNEVIFSINENGNQYNRTIENKVLDNKRYTHYLGYGYYHYGFEQEYGNDNTIYNIHSDKKIENKAKARYLNLFRFKNKIYFYYYAPIYDKPSGYMTIFDENGNEIDIYSNRKDIFKYLYTKKGHNIEAYKGSRITHIDDNYIYALSDNMFYILDSDMKVIKELSGSYKKVQVFGEGKYQVFALSHDVIGDNNTTDFFDCNLNEIVKSVKVKGPITTDNILNKVNKKHYIAISYVKENYRDQRNEHIFVFDEQKNKYLKVDNKDIKMYDFSLPKEEFGRELYIRYGQYTQRSQSDRYHIYDSNGGVLLDNVIIYNVNINRMNNIISDLPEKYLVIYDDISTKFLDHKLNLIKEFEGKKRFSFVGKRISYLNDYYNTGGENTYYIAMYDDKYTLEKVLDNNLKVVADNKEKAEKFIELIENE